MEANRVITTDQAVSAVLANNKQSQTILALSKCDLVNETKVESLIVRRVLGEDSAFNSYCFKGCVATRCRDQMTTHGESGVCVAEVDECGIRDIEKKEDTWADGFIKRLRDLNPSRTPDMLAALRSNLTVARLLEQLDGFYHNHICDVWRPLAEAKIVPLIAPAEQRITDLGTDPAALKASMLLFDIEKKLKGKSLEKPVPHPFPALSKPRDTREGATEATSVADRFYPWVDTVLNAEDPDNLLGMAALNTAISSVFNEELPMKTARFGEARRLITDAIRADMIARVHAERVDIKKRAHGMLRTALCSARAESVMEVANQVVTEVLYFCVNRALSEPSRLANSSVWVATNSAALLTESPERHAARVSANEKLAKLRESLLTVQHIRDYMIERAATVTIASGSGIPSKLA